MAWLEMHQSLWGHRKTTRLMAALNVSRPHAVGLCAALWMWGLDNAQPSGYLRGIADTDIAAAVEWPLPDAAQVVEGLVSSGFLDRKIRGLYLHNWPTFTERFHKTRLSATQRKRRQRARSRENESTGHADVTRDKRDMSRLPSGPSGPSGPSDTPTVPPSVTGAGDQPARRPAGVGVGKSQRRDRKREDGADLSMEELRGAPFDIVAACDSYLGRCLWDWFPLLDEMKRKYELEELQYAFEEARRRRGKTPKYVQSIIEGRRHDDAGSGPEDAGQRSERGAASALTLAEYQRLQQESASAS